MYRSLLLAVAVLSATPVLAQEDGSMSLDGVGRVSIQTGWRMTTNSTFYDGYYGKRPGLQRGASSPGGPLVVGSFSYGVSESMELGIDLFGTGERLLLTDQPELTTTTYGALVGLRMRTVLELGSLQLIPSAGILTGPTLVYSRFQGSNEGTREDFTQAWVGAAGATLRLTPGWGLTAEYRLAFVRGHVAELGGQKFGSFNAGGSWLSLGVAYTWPPEPSRPFAGGIGF